MKALIQWSLATLLGASFFQLHAQGDPLGFDDLSPGEEHAPIPDGYGGLTWSNWHVLDGSAQPRNGYGTGTISARNVAFNPHGAPATISSHSLFTLASAYLTAAFVEGLNLRVEGFAGGHLAFSETHVLNPTTPTFVRFPSAPVDRVVFTPSPETQFALDNLRLNLHLVTTKTLGFDAFTPGMDHHLIPEGYGGLTWHNFQVLNAFNQSFRSGYRHGMISQKNVAFNAFGDPAQISSRIPFDLHSGYFTAASPDDRLLWTSAYIGNRLVYKMTHQLSPAYPTLINFNFTGITRVLFETLHDGPFALDNLRVTTAGIAGDAPENDCHPLEPTTSAVDLGTVVVSTIGRSGGRHYFIDQRSTSRGGALLPTVSVNWNTNTQFSLTVSAPAGKRFRIHVPSGGTASFAGFLWWEAGNRGGRGPSGPVQVKFFAPDGTPPAFSESDAVLSDSHGFFGVYDLESTPITNTLSFESFTILGTVSPQETATGFPTRQFVPHLESSLSVFGNATVEIISSTTPTAPAAQDPPSLSITSTPAGQPLVIFTGALQSADSLDGPFNDLPDATQGHYLVPDGDTRFFRARSE